MHDAPVMLPLQSEINAFLTYMAAERRASRNTVLAYQRDLAQLQMFLQVSGYHAGIEALDKGWLRRWLATLGSPMKPESVARKVSCLRSFFKFLLREGICRHDPAARLATPKLGRRLPKFLSPEDAAAVMENPSTTSLEPAYRARDEALLEVLYGCGLRVSELCGLNLESLEEGGWLLRVVGKGNKERLIPVGSKANGAIHHYLEHRPELRHPRTGTQEPRALFLNRHGGRLTVRSVQRLVHRYGAWGAGRPDLHPHALRHSCATHMLEGGADLRAIQDFLGHASLSTTQRYTHVSMDQLLKVYDTSHPLAGKRKP